jgi:hypothetical protein
MFTCLTCEQRVIRINLTQVKFSLLSVVCLNMLHIIIVIVIIIMHTLQSIQGKNAFRDGCVCAYPVCPHSSTDRTSVWILMKFVACVML